MATKRQGLAAVAAAALGIGLAGCGTAKSPGVVQAPSGGATVEAVSSTPTTSTSTTTTTTAVKTPTSGPLSKAPVMAIVIAGIGCRQGMEVGGDVESLGRRVTAAVVHAIFAAILIDAIFALVYMKLNI